VPDASGRHAPALDASKDAEQLDLAALHGLEIDFWRTLYKAVYRALAPSGVLNIDPRSCWDRDTEGSYYVPAPIRSGRGMRPSKFAPT
jgi:hypothetical protein